MAAALFELRQQLGEDLRFGHDQHVVHDLSDLHAGNAGGGGLAEVAEAKSHPAHEVFVVQHAHDMLGAALRVIHGDARVLAFDDAGEGVVEHEVGGQRKNVGTGDHDFPRGDVVEFDGAVDHLLLKLGNLAELAAGGHDELQFVGRVDEPQDQATGPAHKEEDGTGERKKGLHGRSHRKRHLLSPLQGKGLGHEFAEDHVHVGDQAEGDRDGDGMSIDGGMRDTVDELHPFDQAGHHGLADPAQGKADHGNSKLNAVDDFVEVLVEALHDAGADTSGINELLNAGVADTDQGKLGGREERIGCHQEKDQKDPEQHKSDHGKVILAKAVARGQWAVASGQWPVVIQCYVGTAALG